MGRKELSKLGGCSSFAEKDCLAGSDGLRSVGSNEALLGRALQSTTIEAKLDTLGDVNCRPTIRLVYEAVALQLLDVAANGHDRDTELISKRLPFNCLAFSYSLENQSPAFTG